MRPLDPGVQVAPGDPHAISGAAAWHSELADSLELQHGVVTGTASSVISTWNGEAAGSYQQLASVVGSHFLLAAGSARTAAEALFRYAAELERCQQEGTQALHQAEHWLGEQVRWQTKLTAAQTAITTAQGQIFAAQQSMYTVLGPNPLAPPTVNPAAAAELHAAEAALRRAQADQRTAQRELQHCEHEVLRWQARGRQIWGEAVQAGEQATGYTADINVAPPPLAGWIRPDRFNTPPPVTHHDGGFFDDPLGTIEHLASSAPGAVYGGLEWAVNQAPSVAAQAGKLGLEGFSTLIRYSPIGQGLHLASQLSGSTIGGCIGGSATAAFGFGYSIHGSICYEATPSGDDGTVVTAGYGAAVGGTGAGVSGEGLTSDGQRLSDQGRYFHYVTGTVGDGGTVNGGWAWGRNSQGRSVHTGTAGVGIGASDSPAGVDTGTSYSVTGSALGAPSPAP